MKIQSMFQKDIDRPINGVVKVMQDDQQSLKDELSEYIITKELRRHFATFFDNYVKAIDTPTDKIGVWISGFFGSGKSHFLKMLSYLLANKEVDGKHAFDYFADKFDDPMMYATVQKCVRIPTESILFNIDIEGPINKDKTAVLRVLAAIFIPVHIARKQNKIALFEANLKCYGSLISIKCFCEFISGFTTFADNPDPKAEVHSPIEVCKNKYLEIHDLLSNEKAMSQIRTSTFWKTTFTRDCINHDREAICSGAFLTKATAFDAAEKIGKALHEFVVALFDSGKPEVIAEKRDEFTKNSAEINNLIDALRKELEI